MENPPSSPESAQPRLLTLEEAREAKKALRDATAQDERYSGITFVGILSINYEYYSYKLTLGVEDEIADEVARGLINKAPFSDIPIDITITGPVQAG